MARHQSITLDRIVELVELTAKREQSARQLAEQTERLAAYALKLEREHSQRVTAKLRQAEQERDLAARVTFETEQRKQIS